MERKKVFVASCQEYSCEKILRVIERGIEAVCPEINPVRSGERVLLKPNLLSASGPERAVTTHPEFVKAAGLYYKSHGYDICIGDGSGPRFVRMEKVWEKTEMAEAASFLDAEMVNFSRSGAERINDKKLKHFSEIPIYTCYRNSGKIINLPKIKTHNLMGFTGAVKNLFGFVAGHAKVNCHRIAPNASDFAEILVYLYREIRPLVNIVDGIVAMEGNGPGGGDPKKLGVIIIGEDALSVDVVMAWLMGINIKKNPMFSAFRREGIRIPFLDEIDITGEDIERLRPDKFSLSRITAIYNLIPSWLVKIAGNFFKVFPYPEKEKCTSCGLCKKACPADAIEITPEVAIVDRKKCVNCFCCTEICPVNAIEFKYSRLARKIISE